MRCEDVNVELVGSRRRIADLIGGMARSGYTNAVKISGLEVD